MKTIKYLVWVTSAAFLLLVSAGAKADSHYFDYPALSTCIAENNAYQPSLIYRATGKMINNSDGDIKIICGLATATQTSYKSYTIYVDVHNVINTGQTISCELNTINSATGATQKKIGSVNWNGNPNPVTHISQLRVIDVPSVADIQGNSLVTLRCTMSKDTAIIGMRLFGKY